MNEKPQYPMRINKYLALQGQSTRRGADELIEKKRVFINGRLAVLGDKVTEQDKVEVVSSGRNSDDKNSKEETFVYFAYNKKRDQVLQDRMHLGGYTVFPVAPLEKEAHGLVLLTNDRRIGARLLDPLEDQQAVFEVTLSQPYSPSLLKILSLGVNLEHEKTKSAQVEPLEKDSFHITTKEATPRLRAMCGTLGFTISNLYRTGLKNITVQGIAEGGHHEISGKERDEFLKRTLKDVLSAKQKNSIK